ncbi:PilV type IV pilus minor pilin subunit, shufflon protein, partial [Candidatus Regiella insecticola 5.15]
ILDVPMLIKAGYLPKGFSAANNFSSRYHTRIYQPSALKFHHMIFLAGGAPLSFSAARKIATRIGGIDRHKIVFSQPNAALYRR